MSSEKVRLGDICKVINGGNWTSNEYAESGIPVVRVSDMKNGTVDVSDLKHLEESEYERYKKHELHEGDLVLATVGSHKTSSSAAGRATIIPRYVDGMLLNQNAACLRTDSDKLDQKYLCYLGQSPEYQSYLQTMGKGAANQMRIALSSIRDYEFTLPSIQEQKQIAGILSAFDNLIEVNRQRIEQLERAARLLYREWFVHHRFPGHEHTEIVDGVPEGWEEIASSEVIEIMSGGTPKTSVDEYWNGEVPFFTPKDSTSTPFVSKTEKHISEAGLRNSSTDLFPKGTIFITARGTVGKLNLNRVPMAMNQSCYALKGKDGLSNQFLYLALRSAIEHFEKQATGAVFDAIIMSTFNRIPLAIPTKDLVRSFGELIAPVFRQVDLLIRENERLQKARDILLPRLMSGEIKV